MNCKKLHYRLYLKELPDGSIKVICYIYKLICFSSTGQPIHQFKPYMTYIS